MAFFQIFRFGGDQTEPTKPTHPRFAPGWLAENQRTAIKALVGVLVVSLGGNLYQFYLREKIPTIPPETFIAVVDSTFSTAKVINARDLKSDELKALATAEVQRLVYRLRRVADSRQVDENIDMLPCSVTGEAAAKANRYMERGSPSALLKKGQKRVLSERAIRADLKPGEKAREDGMWISANWTEEVDEGVRTVRVERTAEFHVQRFSNLSPKLRSCNPTGMMIVDYALFDAD